MFSAVAVFSFPKCKHTCVLSCVFPAGVNSASHLELGHTVVFFTPLKIVHKLDKEHIDRPPHIPCTQTDMSDCWLQAHMHMSITKGSLHMQLNMLHTDYFTYIIGTGLTQMDV